jgi:mRNA interferase RelE/StbE
MWKVEFTQRADKEFSKLTPEIQKRIDKTILEKLLVDPERFLIPLHGDLAGLYKFRVGDYRLLCDKKEKRLIIDVIRVGHRREVYH